jgi:tRNA modification GTPase
MMNDNIVAIATPPGEAGIAIIRLSGKNVIEICNRFFQPYSPSIDITKKASHTLTLGWILDTEGKIIDEVLLSVMKSPHSYTGENVVEINCHGGYLAVKLCLERCLAEGLRLAQPGEFTKRAFLNGRLDLSQAESVIDIINAKSERGLKLALQQLQGKFSKYIDALEDDLIRFSAMISASLDFPEDVGELNQEEAASLLSSIEAGVDKLLEASARNEVYRQGVDLVICGKPNVGKSSLLNCILRQDRAIVTEIPGTTRDVIEDYINIKGIPIKIKDTAGIRETEDFVEKIGVEKTRAALLNADIIIFLLDMEAGISDEDLIIYQQIMHQNNIIILINKDDLQNKNISPQELKKYFNNVKIIRGSVKEEQGINELENSIQEIVMSGQAVSDELEVTVNIRQKESLLRFKKQLDIIKEIIKTTTLDCLDVEVSLAREALEEISGKSLQEDVLDRVFRDFCIGK